MHLSFVVVSRTVEKPFLVKPAILTLWGGEELHG